MKSSIYNIQLWATIGDPERANLPQVMHVHSDEFFITDLQKAVEEGRDPLKEMIELLNLGSKYKAVAEAKEKRQPKTIACIQHECNGQMHSDGTYWHCNSCGSYCDV